MISRLFHFFETLVDPYTAYPDTDTPPRRLFAFLWDYSQPFKKLFAATAIMSLVVAAIEIGLIWYMGRVVDLLSSGVPSEVLADHGVELILAALFVLTDPAAHAGARRRATEQRDPAAVRHADPLARASAGPAPVRGLVRERFRRAHRQPDHADPLSGGEAVFQIFDAITFALAYLVGAAILLFGADPRLLLPLLAWFVLYGWLLRWTIVRIGPASQASADARSATTGRIVDTYTNIHAVKLFAHHDREIEYAKEAIETTRRTFAKEMRLFTIMDIVLTILNGLLIVAVVGWAVWLWAGDAATVGTVAAATALTLRLNAMTGWIMWAVSSFFRSLGVVAEGMETITDPITLTDAPGARPLEFDKGEIRFEEVSHHYGRGAGAGSTG
jgi:ATP-binding cassette subfamily B multidrug efflux pump